jgi:hypothetical protein
MSYHHGVDSEANQKTLEPDALVRDVEEARYRLTPLLPGIDPGDLVLILQSLFRAPGTGRRFLLRQVRPGVYVP